MSTTRNRAGTAVAVSALLAFGVLLSLGIGSSMSSHGGLGASSSLKPDAGTTQQWAFGGHAGATFSCSGSACGANSSISSLNLHYFVEWVVIYTATNISSTQTEYEAQAAINATVALSLQGCINESATGPCSEVSASGNLAGKDLAAGFTNVTKTGNVDLTSGPGSPGLVDALAVMNAESNAAFNFSGSFSETLPVNGTSETLGLAFDLGGSELSSISFASPLGVVPIDPQAGQSWNSSAPYTASGSYTSGYSITESVGGQTHADNDWQNTAISPSGTLDLNGSDVGAVTLYDNYTSPPTSQSEQLIVLNFGAGEFAGADGWLLIPDGLYAGAFGALTGVSLIADQPSSSTTAGGGESAYYQSGLGFVGAAEAANTSALGLGSTGPEFSVQAGPEPVSVASQQYSAITSSGTAAGPFPWAELIVVAVVVVVAVMTAIVALARIRRRPPVANAPPVDAPVGGSDSGPASSSTP